MSERTILVYTAISVRAREIAGMITVFMLPVTLSVRRVHPVAGSHRSRIERKYIRIKPTIKEGILRRNCAKADID